MDFELVCCFLPFVGVFLVMIVNGGSVVLISRHAKIVCPFALHFMHFSWGQLYVECFNFSLVSWHR